tara:strand:+ start:15788 stop:16192 length:405 start_codon:yes stop_codon:yes gene_type:complete
MGVEVFLFVNMVKDVTHVVSVVMEVNFVNIIKLNIAVVNVRQIYTANMIDRNIIAGNVFQKNFAFITKELTNATNVKCKTCKKIHILLLFEPLRESNPRPRPPKGRIIPLDQAAILSIKFFCSQNTYYYLIKSV